MCDSGLSSSPPGELLCGSRGFCCSCSLLQCFCSSLHTCITQILTGIACGLGFRLAFQISCSAKELIFIFYHLSEQRAASGRLHPTPRGSLLSSALNFQFQKLCRMRGLRVQRRLLSTFPSWAWRCVDDC